MCLGRFPELDNEDLVRLVLVDTDFIKKTPGFSQLRAGTSEDGHELVPLSRLNSERSSVGERHEVTVATHPEDTVP